MHPNFTPEALARSRRNLVVHESDLPSGRGMSPLTWQVIEGQYEIPICLLEAIDEVDAGAIIYRNTILFDGHELVDELRRGQGEATIELCLRFLSENTPPAGSEQSGFPSTYVRRTTEDSMLNPHKSIAKQFDLLRTVDNDKYPAFFDLRGHRYRLQIVEATNDKS